jgi:EAL domain-containing protein (putative c-di-GMP-specific phosphodiesterase class I)
MATSGTSSKTPTFLWCSRGAENDATLRLLRELRVDFVQSYVIGRPTSARDALNGNS